jgi:replicative DNA helicase
MAVSLRLLELGKLQHLFLPSEVDIYDFVAGFAKEYGKITDNETVQLHLGAELTPPTETAKYYHDLMKLRWTEHELKRGMKAAAELLGIEGKDALGALGILSGCVTKLVTQQEAYRVTDFRGAYGIVVPDYVAKYTEDYVGVNFGWPTFDEMTGGLIRGNLVSIVGKIARGKTWQLLASCHHGWCEQGLSQMFVSMEMPSLEIHQRLSAILRTSPSRS